MANVYTPEGGRKGNSAELRTLVLRVPMPENVTNLKGSSAWRRIHKAKRDYQEGLRIRAIAGLIPKAPEPPFERAIVSSVMKLGGAMDDDNAAARHKPLLDWLRRSGYIVDDRRKCLRWKAFPAQIVQRDGNYWIELTLEEVRDFSSLEDR
jgi:hypothetical protein